jgi:hypothetical protein
MDAYISIISGLILLIVGYFLGKRQDVINKRREMRVNYLINAWRLIEDSASRKDNKQNKNLETAIADIQLFGSKKQIKLVQTFADDFANNGVCDALTLLINLRNDLRKELHLEKVSDTFKFLRIEVERLK